MIISRRKVSKVSFSDDIHPLLQRVFAARGVVSDDALDLSLKALLPPNTLKGLPEAVALLTTALQQQQRVLIVGDFDADGATSCVLAIRLLRAMGLQQVDYLVPNRFEYGYGLTPEIVEQALGFTPDLLMTVDNGIASVAGVAKAKNHNIQVIVTDHHLPPEQLPDADAIVNPNQQGCEFASQSLAGVGVIFYVLTALRAHLREQGWFENHSISEPIMADYLDLVALGTVADVVPLDHNNRILVHQGVQRIRAGKCRPGILALLSVAGKDYRYLSSSDIGFAIGPRLNAAGRLDDMSVGIQCLLSDDNEQAYVCAQELDTLNRERRSIEGSMQQEALQKIETMVRQNTLPTGMCFYDPSWHEGVVGLVASRIKETFHRPVIAFAPAGTTSNTLKGSARSIGAIHMRDTLNDLATSHPDILQKFGGHAMAAGLSIQAHHYDTFAELFNQAVIEQLTEDDLQDVLLTDGNLTQEELTLEVAHLLANASPWGQQFPEPLFEGEFILVQQRIVGEKHLKMVVAPVANPQQTMDAIAFNIDPAVWPDHSVNHVSIAYHLSINRYRGQESLQLLVKYIEKC